MLKQEDALPGSVIPTDDKATVFNLAIKTSVGTHTVEEISQVSVSIKPGVSIKARTFEVVNSTNLIDSSANKTDFANQARFVSQVHSVKSVAGMATD